MAPHQDWNQMREGIIGLGAESSRRSYYPELLARVAELEQAQEGLRRSEANLRTLFNGLPDGVIIHDREGRVLEVNAAMLAMYGVSEASFRTFSILDYSAPVAGPALLAGMIAERMDQLARDGHTVFQWRARRPLEPGVEFDVEVSLRRARWYDQEAVVAVVRDISERKRIEALLQESQKLESLGQLAGGVAHDTNNMLGVILGYAELLLEEAPAGSRLRQDLEQIRKASLSSAGLIRQLLAFARRQPIQPLVLDLNLQVEHTQQMLRRLVGEQYPMTWKPAAGLWLTRADPSQLEQILANLCVNARDALAPGQGITIETANVAVDAASAKAHPDAYPGDFVALVVADGGKGMGPEVQARIFEPFFTTKEVGRGTGLGLATVYGIVRQNHGFITVQSAPGAGTTFRVHLPRHLEPAEAPGQEPESAAPAGRETILLVEDEAALLALGSRLLEAAGYRVIPCADPLAALAVARNPAQGFDLLATDLVMPGLNGRELYEQVRALRPGVRALFLSGYPAGTISLDALPGSGLGYLQKPFSRGGLLRKVRDMLDG